MFRRAQDLIKVGNNTIASKLLHRCLELNPRDSHRLVNKEYFSNCSNVVIFLRTNSWLAIARLEAKMCNYQRSRELFSQAVQNCPNNIHILHAWGHMEEVPNNIY